MVEVFKGTPIRRMTTGGNYVNLTADVVLLSDYEALRAELEQVKRNNIGLHDEVQFMRNAAKENREAAERLAGARVKVKALGDWRRGYCYDEVTIEQVPTGFGSIYQVRIFEGKIWLDYPVREKEAFPTVEAAKAAAQADYERRIIAALAEPAGEVEPSKWSIPGSSYAGASTPPDASAIREAEKIDPVELVRQEIQKLSKEKDAAEYVIATMVTNLKTGKVTTDQLLEWFDGEGRAALAGAKP